MRTFGLVGYPLTHSFSQQYFTKKFEELGINDAEYLNFSIPAIEDLSVVMQAHQNLSGFNITIPYKKKVLSFLHEAAEDVIQMGACNCVSIRDGKLKGFNTDIVGFSQSLQPFLKPHHIKALILGTGGAAAAVEYVMQQLGISYKFVSRNPAENQFSYEALDKTVMDDYTLIINTSPVGQYPSIQDAPDIPYQFISSRHHLFDLIYNPAETTFLQKGKAMGASIQNGYEMLVLQAEESWRIWNEAD